MGFQALLLPGKSHAHGSLGTFHHGVGISALLTKAGELFEPCPENRLHTRKRRWLRTHFFVELAQIHSGPEPVLKFQLSLTGFPEDLQALENQCPGDDRCQHQQEHDQLHQNPCIRNQMPD